MSELLLAALFFPAVGFAVAPRARLRGSAAERWAERFLLGFAGWAVLGFLAGVIGVPIGRALVAAAFLVGVGGCAIGWRERKRDSPPYGPNPIDWLAFAPLAVAALSIATLPLRDFDGRNFWIPKARAIAHERVIDGPFFRGETGWHNHTHYPLAVPLGDAAILALTGRLDETTCRWNRWLIALAFVLLVRRSARERLSPRAASAVAAAVAFLPAFASAREGGVDSAYADIAVAAFFLATCAAFRLDRAVDGDEPRGPLPTAGWLLAGLILTKNEGMVLAGAVFVALVLMAVLERAKFGRRALVMASVPVLLAFALLSRFRSLVPLRNEEDYAARVPHLFENLGERLRLAGGLIRVASESSVFGLFWPVVAVSFLATLATTGRRRAVTVLPLLVFPAIAAVSAFALSGWDPDEILGLSGSRLLLQIVGPASLLVALALEDQPGAVRSE